jgi:hypothetical protein
LKGREEGKVGFRVFKPSRWGECVGRGEYLRGGLGNRKGQAEGVTEEGGYRSIDNGEWRFFDDF